MKLKQKHIASGLMAALMLVLAMAGFTSCKDTETVDSSGFKLFYTSLTDIGPSMQGSIAEPSYKGPAPSDFKITAITFGENNETFDNSKGCFVIDSSTGSIFIDHTEDIAVGLYKISVSCVAGGVTYNFPDIVTVNFLNAVPEGVVVEPDLLVADQNDILDEKSEASTFRRCMPFTMRLMMRLMSQRPIKKTMMATKSRPPKDTTKSMSLLMTTSSGKFDKFSISFLFLVRHLT